MIGFADQEFRLSAEQATGGTLRDHIEADEATRLAFEKDAVTLPAEMAHVWEWFTELHSARGSSGFGPLPISYAEIDAWARLTAREPAPWEISAVKQIDNAYLRNYAKTQEVKAKK